MIAILITMITELLKARKSAHTRGADGVSSSLASNQAAVADVNSPDSLGSFNTAHEGKATYISLSVDKICVIFDC